MVAAQEGCDPSTARKWAAANHVKSLGGDYVWAEEDIARFRQREKPGRRWQRSKIMKENEDGMEIDPEIYDRLEALEWEIDLMKGTCKSELAHFRVISGNEYHDIDLEWINPDVPADSSILHRITRSVDAAFRKAMENI
jgi:hypothetical protein